MFGFKLETSTFSPLTILTAFHSLSLPPTRTLKFENVKLCCGKKQKKEHKLDYNEHQRLTILRLCVRQRTHLIVADETQFCTRCI